MSQQLCWDLILFNNIRSQQSCRDLILFNTNSIQIQYKFNTNSIEIQYNIL